MRNVELEIITDITTNDSNRLKILVKGDKIKKIFDLDDIELEEYIDSKTGKHIKKYASVVQKNVYFKVNKPYVELKEIMLSRSTPVLGFAYKSKRYK